MPTGFKHLAIPYRLEANLIFNFSPLKPLARQNYFCKITITKKYANIESQEITHLKNDFDSEVLPKDELKYLGSSHGGIMSRATWETAKNKPLSQTKTKTFA